MTSQSGSGASAPTTAQTFGYDTVPAHLDREWPNFGERHERAIKRVLDELTRWPKRTRVPRYTMYVDESWRVSMRRKSCDKKVIRDLRNHLGHIRVVSGKTDVLLYVETAEDAEEAQRVAQAVLARHNSAAVVQVEHWDVASEAWKAPSARSSSAASEPWAAHERRQKQEREQSMTRGLAAWQVRVDLPSHVDVSTLSERLKSEGWPVVQRRKHLVAGANCEDEAAALAHEIEGHCGADAVIRIERSVFGWVSLSSIFPPGPSG